MSPFKVALIKSEAQFILRTFEHDQHHTEVHDLEDLTKKAISAVFLSSELSEQTQNELLSLSKQAPIRKLSDFGLTENQWVELDQDSIRKLTIKAMSPWLLHNGISVIEELKSISTHLQSLWPNDRTTFFEELWSHIKRTWGTLELKIIYNDLSSEAKGKESEKHKLVRSMISGKRQGHPLPAGEGEERVMDHYQGEFSRPFDIIEFDLEKGELVALATIKQSPILIMAKVFELSRLQKAVISALIESID